MDIRDLKSKIKDLEEKGLVNNETEVVIYCAASENYLEVNNIRVAEGEDLDVVEDGLLLEIDY